MKLKLSKILYDKTRNLTIADTAGNHKIGDKCRSLNFSRYRLGRVHPGWENIPPKYSVIGYVAANIFESKENLQQIFNDFYISDDNNNFYYRKNDNFFYLNLKDKSIKYSGDTLNLTIFLLAAVCNNDELKEIIKKLSEKTINNKLSILPEIEEQDMALLQDSFYYGNVKDPEGSFSDVNVISVDKSEINLELTRMIKLNKVTVFYEIMFSKGENSLNKEKISQENVIKEKISSGDFILSTFKKVKLDFSEYHFTKDFISIVKKLKKHLENVIERMNNDLSEDEIIGEEYYNILLAGKPSTGKSIMAKQIAKALGLPFAVQSCTMYTEDEDFSRKSKLAENNISVNIGKDKSLKDIFINFGKAFLKKGNGFAYQDSNFLNIFKNGGIICIEEINLLNANVAQGALGQALEKPFTITTPDGETIKRHPLCIVIGTMNLDTAGVNLMNEALLSRFKQPYIIDDPTEEDFIDILEMKGYETEKCIWVYKVYSEIIRYLTEIDAEDILNVATMRGCLSMLENLSDGETQKEALKHSLLGQIYIKDRIIAKDIESVLNNKPNSFWKI